MLVEAMTKFSCWEFMLNCSGLDVEAKSTMANGNTRAGAKHRRLDCARVHVCHEGNEYRVWPAGPAPTTVKKAPFFSLASVMKTKPSGTSGTETYQGLNHGSSNNRGTLAPFCCVCVYMCA